MLQVRQRDELDTAEPGTVEEMESSSGRLLLGISLDIGSRDGMRWLTWISLGGLALAAVLAATGGVPVGFPEPIHRVGLVGPTCGLTRGSTAIAAGDFGLAWRYNPASFVVMAGGAAGVVRLLVGLLTRRWINLSFRRSRTLWIVAAVLIAALWVNQQSNADFIINSVP